MRYLVLATDYDGTIAEGGRVTSATLAALGQLAASGRRLILNTGRNLAELFSVLDEVDLFDLVIAENGAVLYWPHSRRQRVLAEAPPIAFIAALRARGVSPLAVGEVSVSTTEEHMAAVVETIHAMGLGLQVIFNRDSVMILPPNVNKATALAIALDELGLSLRNTVVLGDGDNDIPAFEVAECAVAVANALPSLRARADLVLSANSGLGAEELVQRLLATDLAEVVPQLDRHDLVLGRADDGSEVRLHPYGRNLLVLGPAAAGQTTVLSGVLARLAERGYQFCLLDPAGDYEGLAGAVTLGTANRPPAPEEVARVLEQPSQNASATLSGLPTAQQPAFLEGLLEALTPLRARAARPHFLVLAETERLLPTRTPGVPLPSPPPPQVNGLILATASPEVVSVSALAASDLLVAVGADPAAATASFAAALGEPAPSIPWHRLAPSQAVAWFRGGYLPPLRFQLAAAPHPTLRQRRVFAGRELAEHDSFYFRGPAGHLRLRAQNLEIFLQIGEGVDDETWLFHLRRGDYERWVRQAFGDEALAREFETARQVTGDDAQASRELIKLAVERHYAPA